MSTLLDQQSGKTIKGLIGQGIHHILAYTQIALGTDLEAELMTDSLQGHDAQLRLETAVIQQMVGGSARISLSWSTLQESL